MVNEAGPDVALKAFSCESGMLTLPPQLPLITNPAGMFGELIDAIADARFIDNNSISDELSVIAIPNTLADDESAPCCTPSPEVVVIASAFVASMAVAIDRPEYVIGALGPELLSPPLLQPYNASAASRADVIDNREIMPDMIKSPEKFAPEKYSK